MDWGWLKVLVEKLRIHSIIGSGVFVALCAIFISQDLWILVLTGLLSFLIIEFIIYLFVVLEKKQKNKRENLQNKDRHEAEQNKYIGLIWHLFLGLSEMNVKLAIAIFNAPKDPSDTYVRIIKKPSSLYNMYSNGTTSDLFIKTTIGDYNIACIHRELIGDSVILRFDPYFYSLVEEFLKTGLKKKM